MKIDFFLKKIDMSFNKYSGLPKFTGVIERFHDDGYTYKYKCSYLSDLKNGKEEFYNKNGELIRQINWFYGKKNGTEYIWNNGRIWYECTWIIGQKHGWEYTIKSPYKRTNYWYFGELTLENFSM